MEDSIFRRLGERGEDMMAGSRVRGGVMMMLEMVLEERSGFGLRLRFPLGLGSLQPLGCHLGRISGPIGRSASLVLSLVSLAAEVDPAAGFAVALILRLDQCLTVTTLAMASSNTCPQALPDVFMFLNSPLNLHLANDRTWHARYHSTETTSQASLPKAEAQAEPVFPPHSRLFQIALLPAYIAGYMSGYTTV